MGEKINQCRDAAHDRVDDFVPGKPGAVQYAIMLFIPTIKNVPKRETFGGGHMRRKPNSILILFLIASCSFVFTVETEAEDAPPSDLILHATKPWIGDFSGMQKQGVIRALVPFSKMMYSLDGAQQRGISYEELKAFEDFVNKRTDSKSLKVHIIFIPVARDQLVRGLVQGRGDIAVANLTITPERLKNVDFSEPLLSDVSEVVVTGPSAPAFRRLDDLAGREVFVRKSSSYYEHLRRLDQSFTEAGKPAMNLRLADENLEDEDLLEMVNAGLIPTIIVDSHKAGFWAQIFDRITIHSNISINAGGEIGWAFRKNSPKLKRIVNEFVRGHKKGTLFGNTVFNRYLRNTDYVRNSLSKQELAKFNNTVNSFKKYATLYNFDYLMVMAQAYQESRLDQQKRSPRGAIGVMQVLPATARDPNINVANVNILENNIHAGVKYLRFVVDRYFSDGRVDPVNKTLFAFASYNAGPARIAELRQEAATRRLNSNKWFQNVEVVAAKRIGRETVQYVSNIYKYYVAYRMLVDQQRKYEQAKQLFGKSAVPDPGELTSTRSPPSPKR